MDIWLDGINGYMIGLDEWIYDWFGWMDILVHMIGWDKWIYDLVG